MNQILPLLFLYLTGLAVVLPLRCWLPWHFLCASAFLWGALVYVFGGWILLVVGLPYNLTAMAVLPGLLILASFGAWLIAGKGWQDRTAVIWIAGSLFCFLLLQGVLSRFNFTLATYDSFTQIVHADALAREGLTETIRVTLAESGMFLFVLRSLSGLLGSAYLYTLQPTFFMCGLGVFASLAWHGLGFMAIERTRRVIAIAMGLGLLLTTDHFLIQGFYIHTNMAVTVYLLVAVVCFWLGEIEQNTAWTVCATLSLAAFSCIRTETSLITLMMVFLVLSLGKMPYRQRVVFFVPLMLWLTFLLITISPGVLAAHSKALSSSRIQILIALMLLSALLIVFSRQRWLEKTGLSLIPKVMVTGMVVTILYFWLSDPGWVGGYYESMILNMGVYGRWGATWYIVIILLVGAVMKPRLPAERILLAIIPLYFLFLMAIGPLRDVLILQPVELLGISLPRYVHLDTVYRSLGWVDSNNRMLLHILPLVVFYLVMKYATRSEKV